LCPRFDSGSCHQFSKPFTRRGERLFAAIPAEAPWIPTVRSRRYLAPGQRVPSLRPPPRPAFTLITVSLGLHLFDYLAIIAYVAVVLYLGKRAAHRASNQEGFFLAGRKLGSAFQFFLNFGNATDANGAVSTSSLVYQQGASGVWLSLQTLFMNPYYWFMNPLFRRVRLVTVADLFEDRFGSRKLARFYAAFQIFATIFVIIGFGNLVAYKITASLVVKPETSWSAEERVAVEGYRELRGLEQSVRAGTLDAAGEQRIAALREAEARGELRSQISGLDPLTFYIGYTLVVGIYIVMGGLAAAALNEAFQGVLIIVFSIMLIPSGLAAIGGFDALSERLPETMFHLLGSTGASQVTLASLLAILFVSLVQIHGIIGNMSVAGSAKNEFAARFGAVSGTYAKRLMIILWAFVGLIGAALFIGPEALSDPDAVWGTLTLQLLGPGLLGLMLAGLLAANMSTVSAQSLAVSALFVRNLYTYGRESVSEKEAVIAGRLAVSAALILGVFAAMRMDNVFSALQMLLTVNVPFGAVVFLIFYWRRLTLPAVWTAVVVSAIVNILAPQFANKLEWVRHHPVLIETAVNADGRHVPVYFERVVPNGDGTATGTGRVHLELVTFRLLGANPAEWSAANRFAARFFYNGLFPFALLFAVSLLTRPPARETTDRFFGKMKTPVGASHEEDEAAVAATWREPSRFDHVKLFPRSSWEWTRWNKEDTVGFLACCAISGLILFLFWAFLRWAAS
jgi:solute:Na+ symporter, SSS family